MTTLGLAALIAGLTAQPAAADEARSRPMTSSAPAFAGKPDSVTDPLEVGRVIVGFDRHLAQFRLHAGRCDHVVRIPIGKGSPVYGRGLAAYGAYCTLGRGETTAAMCYEEAVGRFALVVDAFPMEQAWIEAFTLRTCASLF